MRSTLAAILIGCLVGSALPAAAPEPTAGPIARSIQRQGEQLAASQDVATVEASTGQDNQPVTDWSRILRLQRGRKLIVVVKGERSRKLTFGGADEHGMTVRSADNVRLIARTDVAEIATFVTQGSSLAAGLGAGLGAWLGLDIALHMGYEVRCQPSCGGVEATMVLSAVGIPVAGAVAGYHLFGHTMKTVIYRSP